MKLKQVTPNGGVEANSSQCQISHSNKIIRVRYKDHILFKNTNPRLYFEVLEREAVGWLIRETDDFICITYDRTVQPIPNEVCESGLLILRLEIVEIREIK